MKPALTFELRTDGTITGFNPAKLDLVVGENHYAPMEKVDELLAILKEARPFLTRANYEAECRHDNTIDICDYETMKQTESLLERIDAALAG